MVAGASPVMAQEILASPSGVTRITIDEVAGQITWAVDADQQPLFSPGALGVRCEGQDGVQYRIAKVERSAGDEIWTPVVGPLSKVPNRYHGMLVHLQGTKPGQLAVDIEVRAYDEGVALRYHVPEQDGQRTATITGRATEFRFQGDTPVYFNRGFTYRHATVEQMKDTDGCLTVDAGDGHFVTLTDADRHDFPQIAFQHKKGNRGCVVGKLLGATVRDQPLPITTSWEVAIIGQGPAKLREHRYLVQNLNPPCALADTGWIQPGNKAICQVYNAKMTNPELKKLLAFASAHHIPYMEIDHSWSGAETKWTDAEIANFEAKKGKFWNDHPEWRKHVNGGLLTPAKGYVPFRPTSYEGGNLVDLQIPELVAYANSLTPKVGICLYIRCALLKEFGGEHAMDDVFRTYAQWGIAGIKPGFIPAQSQANERIIASLVKKAAEHHLVAVIHDQWMPYGLERTYPNLLNVEGVDGEEAEPSMPEGIKSLHDVMLPFTRGMMGAFDYTPQFYKKSKTQCHQMAMIGVYDGRHSIRAGMAAWSPGGFGGEEVEFIQRYPGLFDEEHIVADLGRSVITARRQGATWFIAAMSGPEAVQARLPVAFLDPQVTYRATIFADSPGSLKAAKQVVSVRAADVLSVAMEANGGQVMILDPQPSAP